MATAGTLDIRIRVDASQFERQMRRVVGTAEAAARKISQRFDAIGKSMGALGGEFSAKLTAPIGLLGISVLKMAGDFEQAMKLVKVLTMEAGATERQFAALNEKAKELGSTTMFSASQVAEAMSFMAMAGMGATEIYNGVGATLKLAAAGSMDMAQAADIVTNIMSSQGLSVDELENSVNVLAKSFTSANTDLSMLGRSFRAAGSITKMTGMSFEEVAAALSILGNSGLQAEQAGTGLKVAMLRLVAADGIPKVAQMMNKIGVSVKDASGQLKALPDLLDEISAAVPDPTQRLEVLSKLFGTRGVLVAGALSEVTDQVRQLTSDLNSVGDVAGNIANTRMEGMNGALRRMKSAFEGLAIAIGDSGVLSFFADMAEGLAKWFERLSKINPVTLKFAATVAGLATVLGPLLIGLGAVAWSLGQLSGAVATVLAAMTGPAGLAIVLGVAAYAALKFSGVLDTTADKLRQTEDAIHKYNRAAQEVKAGTESLKGAYEQLAEAIRSGAPAAEEAARLEIDAINRRIAKNKELMRVYELQARAQLAEAEGRINRTQTSDTVELFDLAQASLPPALQGRDVIAGSIDDRVQMALDHITMLQEAGRVLTNEQRKLLGVVARQEQEAARIAELRDVIANLGKEVEAVVPAKIDPPELEVGRTDEGLSPGDLAGRDAVRAIEREIEALEAMADVSSRVATSYAEDAMRRLAVEQAFRDQLSDSKGALIVSEVALAKYVDRYVAAERAMKRYAERRDRIAQNAAVMDQIEDEMRVTERLTEAMLQGEDAFERMELKNELLRSGLQLTNAEFDALIDRIMEQREAFREAEDDMRLWGDLARAPFEAIKDTLVDGSASIGDMLRNFGERFRRILLDELVFKPLDELAKELANGLKEAFQGALKGLQQSMGGSIWQAIGRGIGALFNFGSVTPRALGGGVMSNKPYLVGEKGPELFFPSGSGKIATARETAGMGGGMAMQGNFAFAPTINAPGASLEDIDAAMRMSEARMMSRFGGMWTRQMGDYKKHGGQFRERRR